VYIDPTDAAMWIDNHPMENNNKVYKDKYPDLPFG
jgi:hypothetical protein